jgi:hypothetical protein
MLPAAAIASAPLTRSWTGCGKELNSLKAALNQDTRRWHIYLHLASPLFGHLKSVQVCGAQKSAWSGLKLPERTAYPTDAENH